MKTWIVIALFLFVCKINFAQDLIFKINGDELEVKVLEITPSEVKYKMFKFQDGPTYVLNKTDVFMIKYPNGQKDVFSNTSNNSTSTNTPVKTEDVVANEFVNGGSQQQQQPEQNTLKIINISNPNFKVMHNEIIKTTVSNKEQVNKLVNSLEEAILKDDLKKAWEILEEIKKQN
jgi:hypothetical protein